MVPKSLGNSRRDVQVTQWGRSDLESLAQVDRRSVDWKLASKRPRRPKWSTPKNPPQYRHQAERRRERAIERRIHQAYFAEAHTLEDFDCEYNAETSDRVQIEALASGEFVRRHDNPIFVGQSGLGKSHILQRLGRRFCALGYHVRYTTSAELLVDLTTALSVISATERAGGHAPASLARRVPTNG